MTNLDAGQLSGDILRSGCWTGLRCHEVWYEPGLRLDPHEHALPFFGLSLSGGYQESTGSRVRGYGPRSVVFHESQEGHALVVGDSPVRCFVVELESDVIRDRFDCAVPSSASNENPEAAALLTAMYREFRTADSSTALSLQGLVLQLIASVSRRDARNELGRPPILGRIEAFLREHFRSQFTLEQIATAVGAAPARVSALFRRVHGRSIAEEQRRLRIDHACRSMLDRSLSLADIALECGFADQPHFSRAFRSITGMTPAQYRSLIS